MFLELDIIYVVCWESIEKVKRDIVQINLQGEIVRFCTCCPKWGESYWILLHVMWRTSASTLSGRIMNPIETI